VYWTIGVFFFHTTNDHLSERTVGALVLLDGQHTLDEVHGVLADVPPPSLVKLEAAPGDELEELVFVGVVERAVSAEQRVRDDPRAPYVALPVVGLLLDDFRRQVEGLFFKNIY
jgi:hypothetical protein